MNNSKLLIILTGKTASGKDTVMAKLLERFSDFKRVITTTSRILRAGETNRVDYNFISKEDFKEKIVKGDFIEYVEYGGNLYGTEKSQLISDYNLIWRIDPSRAAQIKSLITDRKLLVIYLTVDDSIVLKRLAARGLPQEEINRRMQEDARFWQEFKNNYDSIIENVPGKLDETVLKVYTIIHNRK